MRKHLLWLMIFLLPLIQCVRVANAHGIDWSLYLQATGCLAAAVPILWAAVRSVARGWQTPFALLAMGGPVILWWHQVVAGPGLLPAVGATVLAVPAAVFAVYAAVGLYVKARRVAGGGGDWGYTWEVLQQ